MASKVKNKINSLRKSFAKIVFDKRHRSNRILDMGRVKNVLFLRNDNKIGDMVVLTLVFRELKARCPDIKISVLCGKDNKEVIKYNPNVDEIIEVSGKLSKDISIYNDLKRRNIDLAVDFFVFRPRPKHLFMIRSINPGFLIGFHKKEYKMYDLSIDCDIDKLHISKRYEELLKELGICAASLDYDVFLEPDSEKAAKDLFGKSGNNLVINPFAASIHRSFSFEKLQRLIYELKNKADLNIYVICVKKSSFMLNGLQSARVLATDSVLESAAYIKYCDYVISPDTSVVHIAAAFKKKLVALFLDYSREKEKINEVWAPGYDGAVSICADTKNSVLTNDINNISNDLIVSRFIKLIKEGE